MDYEDDIPGFEPDGFEHVRQEGDEKLHFSHLHRYVSAYETSDSMVQQLAVDLIAALKVARDTCTRQIVDQDGEMFFVCNPNGTFSLCLEWKKFKTLPLDEMELVYRRNLQERVPVVLRDPPPPPPAFPRDAGPKIVIAPPPAPPVDHHGPYCELYHVTGHDEGGADHLVYCGLMKNHKGDCEFTRSF